MIRKILVSQPAPKTGKSPYFDIAEKYGVQIDFRSLVSVERLTEKEFRAQKVNILDHTAIIFNSRHAIDHFFSMCKDLRVTMPEDMKYFFISENVAHYIQKYVQYRKRKIFYAKSGQWDELVELMVKHKKEVYLYPQNEVHHQDMSAVFDSAGIKHTECTVYRTVYTELDKSIPFDYDMLLFFTPSGVHSLTHNFPEYEQGEVVFGCFGDAPAKTLSQEGFRLDFQAPTPEAPSMSSALDIFLGQQLGDKEA